MKLPAMILTLTLILTSCGDDSSGGGGGMISSTFSDSAVSNFSQIAGVAQLRKGLPQKTMEFIVPSAYAGGGNISCLSGGAVSFQMDALSTVGLTVDTTCSSSDQIDLDIRVALLESLDNLALKRTKTDASYKDGALDFRAAGTNGGFNWNDNNALTTNDLYVVLAAQDCDVGTPGDQKLYEVYSFDKSTGKVTLNTLMDSGDAVTALTFGSHANCMLGRTDADGDGYQDGETNIASFRFVNGALEIDLSGKGIFQENYGSDDDGVCYTATIPASGSCESYYEKFETCTVGVDCYL